MATPGWHGVCLFLRAARRSERSGGMPEAGGQAKVWPRKVLSALAGHGVLFGPRVRAGVQVLRHLSVLLSIR